MHPLMAASLDIQTARTTKPAIAEKPSPKSKLDINTATEEQLQQIPGIGRGLASRIIAARPFKSADDLKNIKGIGSGQRYEKIRPYFN